MTTVYKSCAICVHVSRGFIAAGTGKLSQRQQLRMRASGDGLEDREVVERTYNNENHQIVIELPFLDRAQQYRSRCPRERFRSSATRISRGYIDEDILTIEQIRSEWQWHTMSMIRSPKKWHLRTPCFCESAERRLLPPLCASI